MKYIGQLFAYYLILSGIERLLVEFIRLNPKVIWILTQAQIISILSIIAGILIIMNKRRLKSNEELRMKYVEPQRGGIIVEIKDLTSPRPLK